MGLLKDESVRLLRETWPSATMLAQELYAILNSDTPLTVDGPLTVNNTTSGPALVLRQYGDPAGVALQVQQPGQVSFPALPALPGQAGLPGVPVPPPLPGLPAVPPLPAVPGQPGLKVTNEILNSPSQAPVTPASGSVVASNSNVSLGVVASGTGNSYQVTLFNPGQASSSTVQATVPQIDPDETVPAGTWVIVLQVAGNYYFQVPVWLA